MKRTVKVLMTLMVMLSAIIISPINAKEVELPTLKSVNVTQEMNEFTYLIEFEEEDFDDSININLGFKNSELDSEPGEYYYATFKKKDTVSKKDGIFQFKETHYFPKQYVPYGEYELEFVNIELNDEAGNWIDGNYYHINNGTNKWDKDCKLNLTAEYNPFEYLTAANFDVKPIEKQNFGSKKFTNFTNVYLNKNYDQSERVDITEDMLKDVPTTGSGVTTIKFNYEYNTTEMSTKTIELPLTVQYYGESEGTVIEYDNDNIPEYVINFNNQNASANFSEYYVKLNDGTIVKVKGEFAGGGGHLVDSTVEEPYVEAGISTYVSLKYSFEDESKHPDYIIDYFYRYFVMDDDGNLLNFSGDIVVPYAQRKKVNYLSMSDGVSLGSLEGTLPSNTKLVAKEVKIDDVFKNQEYIAYDMKLISNEEEVQPMGTVSVGVKLPDELKGKDVEVYYVDDEGKTELVEVTAVEKDKVTFTTDHFSTYSIVEKKDTPTTPTDPEDKPETKPEDKPNAPDTSDSTHTNTYVLLMLSMGMVGAFELKRKMNKH